MSLSHDDLKQIGESAARDIIGDVSKVAVDTGIDSDDDLAYYFKLFVRQNGNRELATLERSQVRQTIRDRLLAENDEVYPYVRFIGD